MARIAGVDLPRDKRVEIGLTYIFGLGRTRAIETVKGTRVNPNTRVRDLLTRWYVLLADVAREAERRFGSLGPFTPEEIATLVANAFIGSEALLLLGFERPVMPIRSALRRIGVLIREREEAADRPGGQQAPPRTPPPAPSGPVVAG